MGESKISRQNRWSEIYNDLTSELTIALAAISEPGALDRVAKWLHPEDFWDPVTAAIWSEFEGARSSQGEVDIDRVVQTLVTDGRFGSREDAQRLVDDTLALGGGAGREVDWSARLVRAAAITRRLFAVLEDATDKLVAGEPEEVKSLVLHMSPIIDDLLESHRAAAEELKKLQGNHHE